MKITLTNDLITNVACDVLIVGVFKDAVTPNLGTNWPESLLSSHIAEIISEQSDCGKYGESTVIHTWGAIGAKRVLLLGMGKEEELSIDKARALFASVMRTIQKMNISSVAMVLSNFITATKTRTAVTQAVVEGALLGTYQFNYYKTIQPETKPIETLHLIECNTENNYIINQCIHKATIIGDSVNLTRDLINHPSQYMTPTQMATQAQKIALQNNLEITILEKEDMEKEKMNALLSVAQGSAEPPKMIVLKYNGDITNEQVIAFVGKGVTFDSGGISIKPSLNMDEMKDDMSGGAAVLGAMAAIGRLKPKINIIGIIPCTENMPSGNAYKPGDVIFSMSGKTIEIINTDAEGRLILADAITYALTLGVTQIIDIATLTGACVVALGNITSGLLTNNSTLCKNVLHAAEEVGEKMWQFPNFSEYKEQIKSNIADLKNTGGRMGGAITAGVFIEEFAENVPWVHIDIAGTAYIDKENGYNVKGATGIGTRTLIQLAENMGK
jgi:leucyl aminopeptidase